ncbi:MAG: hypothetical protein ACXVAK_18835 [Vulcanimicrobiaceae bacterium]
MMLLALYFFARCLAIAGDDPAVSPAPSATPRASDSSDVTVEGDPTTRIRTITLQATYTGATYGPGSFRATQIIPRIAALYIGKALLRFSLPRFQTINGLDSGLSDMQFFYLLERPFHPGRVFLGLFAQFPTATSPSFGTGKWLVGPAAAYIFALRPKSAIAGFLVQSAFSVAGAAKRPNQSVVTVLPFGTLRVGHGWYLKLPEAPWIFDLQRGASLIPLGFGVGRTMKVGNDPLLVGISDEATVIHANVINAPKNTVRLTFTVILATSQ